MLFFMSISNQEALRTTKTTVEMWEVFLGGKHWKTLILELFYSNQQVSWTGGSYIEMWAYIGLFRKAKEGV